jgi:carbon monoxide dehydrogenase subunit G
MKISGTNTLTAPVDRVWDAILDPAVLARCLPGCETLTTTGPDEYALRVTAGVAAIKGTYDGRVAITDKDEPGSLRMTAAGSGAPGTIDAVVDVRLAPHDGGGTLLSYDADATVGGTIGGVGQRMLAGVTRKMAGEFFTALDSDIATGGAGAATPQAGAVAVAPDEALPAGVGAVYAGRAPSPGGLDLGDAKGFVLGTLLGGALVAVGVLLGSRLGRRR